DARAAVRPGRSRRRDLHAAVWQGRLRRQGGPDLLARPGRHGGVRGAVVDREPQTTAGGSRRQPSRGARLDGTPSSTTAPLAAGHTEAIMTPNELVLHG